MILSLDLESICHVQYVWLENDSLIEDARSLTIATSKIKLITPQHSVKSVALKSKRLNVEPVKPLLYILHKQSCLSSQQPPRKCSEASHNRKEDLRLKAVESVHCFLGHGKALWPECGNVFKVRWSPLSWRQSLPNKSAWMARSRKSRHLRVAALLSVDMPHRRAGARSFLQQTLLTTTRETMLLLEHRLAGERY